MDFKTWTETRYLRPVVVVDATPAADAACLENGLDVVQLLRPFASLPGSGGAALTAHVGERGEAVSVRGFGARLVRPECVRKVGREGFKSHTQRLMRSSAAMDLAYGEQLDRAVAELIDPESGSPRPSPARLSTPAVAAALLERSYPTWHRSFTQDFHSLVRCGEFETTDHPVGAIFAVSTAEPGGVDGILRAFKAAAARSRQLAVAMPSMDPELHTYYLLVHDVSAAERAESSGGGSCGSGGATAAPSPSPSPTVSHPTLQDARKSLAAVQQLHGVNYCALIKVNSVTRPREIKCLDPSPWVEANPLALDVPSDAAVAEAVAAGLVSLSPASPAAAATTRSSATERVLPTTTTTTTTTTTATAPRDIRSGSLDGSSSPSLPTPPALRFNRVRAAMGKWPGTGGAARFTGCYLMPEDVEGIRNVMGYYLSQGLLRFLERRLRVVDASVQDRRTTTLGKVANWFKSKEGQRRPRLEVHTPAVSGDSGGGGAPCYLGSSLEMMMRHCGDLSLFLQDYSGAAGYYKMCIDELLETLAQRTYNRPMIAACQEAIGVAYFLIGKLVLPSATPWYTGGTRAGLKLSHHCRLEVALNDYLASGTQTYALRTALLLFDFCRTRSPPAMDRARSVLQHILRTGLTSGSKLFAGIISDMLATTCLFANPPYPAGLITDSPSGSVAATTSSSTSNTMMMMAGGGASSLGVAMAAVPSNYAVEFHLRTYVRFLVEAGARYADVGSPETALRCYLRAHEIFRGLGARGCWPEMCEHVTLTVSSLYFALGQGIKGLVTASAAVAQGSPRYSDAVEGPANFRRFWDRQARVLAGMGYSLSPHMPMPCIVRSSFHVSYNYYCTDEATDGEGRRLGEKAAGKEWRDVEDHLRRHYNRKVLVPGGAVGPYHQCRFPNYHGEAKRDRVFANNSSSSSSVNPTNATTTTSSSSSSSSYKHYRIAHTEPLWLSLAMHNPIGGPVTASNISILYMSRQRAGHLWKSAATQSVTLAAGERREVDLAFTPLEPGEYVVIGLCWSLLGQEGYYYFATRESRLGRSESLYEFAIENPTPVIEAAENITVTVTEPRAWLTARLDPPLPPRLRDGEYFRTSLVVTNGSKQRAAQQVTLQRSPRNAHLMFVEAHGIARNLAGETALPLAESLAPGESQSFRLVVRAQHDHGDAVTRCMNNLFFLFGYVPAPAAAVDKAHGGSAVGSVATTTTTTTTGGQHHHQQQSSRDFTGSTTVRLHRLLRSCEVLPLLAIHSTVLPPANVLLSSAVVITAKHISTGHEYHHSNSQQQQQHPSAAHVSGGRPPVRVARIMALHRPQWAVSCAFRHSDTNGGGSGNNENGSIDGCLLPTGSSLTIPLLISRLARGETVAAAEAPLVSHRPDEEESGNTTPSAAAAAAANNQTEEEDDDDGAAYEDEDSEVVEDGFPMHNSSSGSDSTTTTTAASAESRDQLLYHDAECLPLSVGLPAGATAAAVAPLLANLGDGIAGCEMNRYFMRTAYCGAGSVGASPKEDQGGDGGGLAFYLDRAGQAAAASPRQRRAAERRAERRVYGGLLERYTPVVIGLAWMIDETTTAGGEAAIPPLPPSSSAATGGVSSGQIFYLVDPLAFLQTTAEQQQQQQQSAAPHRSISARAVPSGPSPSATTTTPVPVAITADELAGVVASAEHQQRLCECLVHNRSTVAVEQGALVYHASVPPRVATTAGLPGAALAPVTFRCASFAPTPLLVEVAAASPEDMLLMQQQEEAFDIMNLNGNGGGGADLPLAFVGKVQHSFVLMPGDIHELAFTAHVLTPGLVDCNRFTVSAVPLLFLPQLGVATGLSRGDLVRRVHAAAAAAAASATHTGSGGDVLVGSAHSSPLNNAYAADASVTLLTTTARPGGRLATGGGGDGIFSVSFGLSFAESSLAGGGFGGGGLRGAGTSFGAVSLTAAASGSGGGGAVARAQTADVVGHLAPRGFHRRPARVLGGAVPALTVARFLHLNNSRRKRKSDSSNSNSSQSGPRADHVAAVEQCSIDRNMLFAGEAIKYLARAEQFREKEAARAGNGTTGRNNKPRAGSSIAGGATRGGTNSHRSKGGGSSVASSTSSRQRRKATYIYRPRVRVLSPTTLTDHRPARQRQQQRQPGEGNGGSNSSINDDDDEVHGNLSFGIGGFGCTAQPSPALTTGTATRAGMPAPPPTLDELFGSVADGQPPAHTGPLTPPPPTLPPLPLMDLSPTGMPPAAAEGRPPIHPRVPSAAAAGDIDGADSSHAAILSPTDGHHHHNNHHSNHHTHTHHHPGQLPDCSRLSKLSSIDVLYPDPTDSSGASPVMVPDGSSRLCFPITEDPGTGKTGSSSSSSDAGDNNDDAVPEDSALPAPAAPASGGHSPKESSPRQPSITVGDITIADCLRYDDGSASGDDSRSFVEIREEEEEAGGGGGGVGVDVGGGLRQVPSAAAGDVDDVNTTNAANTTGSSIPGAVVGGGSGGGRVVPPPSPPSRVSQRSIFSSSSSSSSEDGR